MNNGIKTDRNSVYGIYRDQRALDKTLNILKSQNFKNADISILMQSKKLIKNNLSETNSKAPEGATTGAATGAVLGGIFGWLLGAGSLVIPGFGPFLAAGPVMSTIAGVGIGGTFGGLAGGLIGLGIPEDEAEKYVGYIKEGGMLITIQTDDEIWELIALEILEENGAYNVASSSEKKHLENKGHIHNKSATYEVKNDHSYL